jgi:hypothetical protein
LLAVELAPGGAWHGSGARVRQPLRRRSVSPDSHANRGRNRKKTNGNVHNQWQVSIFCKNLETKSK